MKFKETYNLIIEDMKKLIQKLINLSYERTKVSNFFYKHFNLVKNN